MSDPSTIEASPLRPPATQFEFGPFSLDVVQRSLTYGEQTIAISSTLFDMLHYLVRHSDRVVTKGELLDAVWPTKTVEESNVSQTIFALRKALAASGATEAVIGTAPGQGYRLVVPVRRANRQAAMDQASSVGPPAIGSHRRRFPMLLATAAAALVGAGGVAAYLTFGHGAAPAAPIPVILADFQNQAGDPVFDMTLQKAARIDLAQSPKINVLTAGLVAKTLDLMTRPKGTPIAGAVADEVCARNNARAVIDGAIARLGAHYLLTLSATDCSGDKAIADEKEVADDREAVIPAIDRLSARVRAKLGETKASIDQFNTPLMPERTASIDALKALTVANDLSTKGEDAEAIPYFQRAIALDPNFARAYAGLAASYYNLNQTDKQLFAIRKAYELRGNVEQSLALNIEILYGSEATNDYNQVIQASRLMTRLYPGAVSAWVNLANAENWLGRPEAAIAPARQAVIVNPKNVGGFYILSLAQIHAGQFDDAHATLAKAAASGLTDDSLDGVRYMLAIAQGDAATSERLAAAANSGPTEPDVLPEVAANAVRLGQLKAVESDYAHLTSYFAAQKIDDSSKIPHARQLAEMGHETEAAALLATAAESTDPVNYLLAQGEFGNPATARTVLARQLAAGPADTLLNAVFAPQARAYLDLRAHNPEAAIAELATAAPYERRDTEIPYLRGVAYLAGHDGAHAAIEFRKIIDHPGVEPTDAQHALALVGLAHALRLQNDLPGSRHAYETFLRLWAKADSDAPVLLDARREYAQLGRPNA